MKYEDSKQESSEPKPSDAKDEQSNETVPKPSDKIEKNESSTEIEADKEVPIDNSTDDVAVNTEETPKENGPLLNGEENIKDVGDSVENVEAEVDIETVKPRGT